MNDNFSKSYRSIILQGQRNSSRGTIFCGSILNGFLVHYTFTRFVTSWGGQDRCSGLEHVLLSTLAFSQAYTHRLKPHSPSFGNTDYLHVIHE